MSDIAIKVENLSKRYRIGLEEELPDTMVGAITQAVKRPFRNWWRLRRLTRFNDEKPTIDDGRLTTNDGQQPALSADEGSNGVRSDVDRDTLWALRDVSFEVQRGEVVGIIGRNGAGKSTLLKILARITHPTSGRAVINGRIGSLLEVGTGFHPELTGRENIYLNGTILGMTKAEVERKFDEIVAFSGVKKFIDTPVKRYSSGMRVRLAFSVAAHLDPEILLVDEVLAVGDAGFQKKCLGKMGEVASEGRTVLFVSHQMAAIENLCYRTLLLENGELAADGNTAKVIKRYLNDVLESSVNGIPLTHRKERSGNGQVRFADFHLEDIEGRPLTSVQSGEDIYFAFGYEASEAPLRNVDIGFSIHSTNNNQMLSVLYSSYQGRTFKIESKKGVVKCRVSNFPFSAGRYRVGGRITVNGVEADWPRDGIGFIDVVEGDFYGSGKSGFNGPVPFLVYGEWSLDNVAQLIPQV